MTTVGAHHVLQAWRSLVPPCGYDHTERHDSSTLAGCLAELPPLPLGSDQLAQLMGCSQAMVGQHLHAWRLLHWRERQGWLQLVGTRAESMANPLDRQAGGR